MLNSVYTNSQIPTGIFTVQIAVITFHKGNLGLCILYILHVPVLSRTPHACVSVWIFN